MAYITTFLRNSVVFFRQTYYLSEISVVTLQMMPISTTIVHIWYY